MRCSKSTQSSRVALLVLKISVLKHQTWHEYCHPLRRCQGRPSVQATKAYHLYCSQTCSQSCQQPSCVSGRSTYQIAFCFCRSGSRLTANVVPLTWLRVELTSCPKCLLLTRCVTRYLRGAAEREQKRGAGIGQGRSIRNRHQYLAQRKGPKKSMRHPASSTPRALSHHPPTLPVRSHKPSQS